MKFHSTRNTQLRSSSFDAIRHGLASDGGLFVSDDLGTTTLSFDDLISKSYQDIALEVLSRLFDDIDRSVLRACIDAAYGEQWDTSEITPLVELGDDFVLELFHGPTSAFKDVALQILPQFMASSVKAQESRRPHADSESSNSESNAGERIMILTATSGDTGKAALEGFADAANTGITVFYPANKVSKIQQLQMTCQQGSNVQVHAIDGNFDDAQTAVKQVFVDQAFNEELMANYHVRLSSANSINVGRLAPQVVYYVYTYVRMLERGQIAQGEQLEFIVPTGNFGNVLAGYYARALGVPVAQFLVASNRNNVLFDFFNTGVYNRQRPFYQTTSPSMDILVSSNLERMLYYESQGDTRLMSMLMNDLQQWGTYEIPEELHRTIRRLFSAGWADDDQIQEAINHAWREHHYCIDPHTACGYFLMQHTARHEGVKRVLLSTASPYKFPRVVLQALDVEAPENDLDCMSTLCEVTGVSIPRNLAALCDAHERFTGTISIDAIRDAVASAAQNM